MKQLKQCVHTALRDDSVATVGLRALLAHAATPWGVYERYLPEQPDFSTKHYLTWNVVSGSAGESAEVDAYLREVVFDVIAWSEDPDLVDDIHMRVRSVLENMRKITQPTSGCAVHQIKWEGHGPNLFDPQYQVYSRAEQYRIWYREDIAQ